jgi:DUF1009 family protein
VGKLGLIAGGGGLPPAIAAACAEAGRPLFVIRLRGMADPALAAFDGQEVGLAELGRCVKALKSAACRQVCFAGVVRRPDFASLKPDLSALKYLPGVIAAARRGDDALLRAVLAVFESEGFEVEGVGEAGAGLLLGPGPLGRVAPGKAAQADIAAAVAAARELGLTDLGQGAIARGGQVVATEDHGGTDALLGRCPPGHGGVLAKLVKPGQDRRVDLPTIGAATIERAAAAGLAGVVGEAGAVLVVDRDAVRAAADRLGLFVLGVTS